MARKDKMRISLDFGHSSKEWQWSVSPARPIRIALPSPAHKTPNFVSNAMPFFSLSTVFHCGYRLPSNQANVKFRIANGLTISQTRMMYVQGDSGGRAPGLG